MADKNIIIKVDGDRISELVSVDDYIALEDGKIKGIRNVVSWFVSDENGGYMPRDKALKLLGSLNLKQLGELGVNFIKAAEEAAAGGPKAQTESTKPITET